jgi:hypothetical protein
MVSLAERASFLLYKLSGMLTLPLEERLQLGIMYELHALQLQAVAPTFAVTARKWQLRFRCTEG